MRCHLVGSARAGAAFHTPRPKGPLISRSTSVVFGVLTFLSVCSGAQTDLLAQARAGLEQQVRDNPENQRLLELLLKIHEQELELLRRDYTRPSTTL